MERMGGTLLLICLPVVANGLKIPFPQPSALL